MNILGIIRQRRSVRCFQNKKVAPRYIHKILEAGRWAPSGLNNQPWRFVVIKETKRKAAVAVFTESRDVLESAAIAIAVFFDQQASYNRDKDLMATGACVQNMLLAAETLGLATCWLGEILNRKTQVARYLHVPKSWELAAVVALGYPDEKNLKGKRKPLRKLLARLK